MGATASYKINIDGEASRQEAATNLERPNSRSRPYVKKRFMLRMDYKGRTIKAWVRSDGKINFGGKVYSSPSIAGARARGKRALNGWMSWKYKNENRDWVYLDELRKGSASKKRPARSERKIDTIICPARREGFERTFIGENCWYAIRLSEKKIPLLRYIAAYRQRPVSAITHYAQVAGIEPYRNTGKYIVRFSGKARKLRTPVVLGAKRPGPQGPFFASLKRIRAAKSIADL